MKQSQIITSIVVVLVLIIGGVFLFSNGGDSTSSNADLARGSESDTSAERESVGDNSDADSSESSEANEIGWRNTEFKDVLTGKKFKISDFEGKPILLESFAVWCPTCKKQQDEIKELHEQVGDLVVSISLDTDPNEDESQVLGHANRNGYDWYFAVSPPSATESLKEEFGISILSAPSAPVVLIDVNSNARLLGSGVKSSDKLLEELNL